MKFPLLLPLLNFPLGPRLYNSASAPSVSEAGLEVDKLSCMCIVHKGRMEGGLVQAEAQLSLGAGDS